MPTATAIDSTSTSNSSSTANDLMQMFRGGAMPNQASLLAAAQQFAAAAAAAQQFAAAAAVHQQHQDPKGSPVKKSRKQGLKTPSAKEPQKAKTSISPNKKGSSSAEKAVKCNPNWDFWTQLTANNTATSDTTDMIRAALTNGGIEKEAEEEELDDEPMAHFSTQEEEANLMPKESEQAERKRPAAIQELLQMKKARLSSHQGEQKSGKMKQEVGEESAEQTAGSHLSEILNRLCNGKEEDAETTSSNCSLHSLEGAHGPNDVSKEKNHPEGKSTTPTSRPDNQSRALLLSTPKSLPSRTNDNDVSESPLASLVPHDRIFAQVPGRLSLLSNVVKYKMSVGEVKRRLMGPESFNFSLLGALLRRAKMPEKSQMLVDELSQVGLSIPRGRRRLSQVTLLSALTESESIQFAKDFQRIADTEFPCQQLAAVAVHQHNTGFNIGQLFKEDNGGSLASTPKKKGQLSWKSRVIKQEVGDQASRLEQLEAALEMTNEFVALLKQDRSPVMDSNADPIFEREVQDPLSTFSMLTHGFGTPAVLVGMQMFSSFVHHQIQLIHNGPAQDQGE